jgi:hypothetical protein
MKELIKFSTSFLIAVFVFVSCKKEKTSASLPDNEAPVANAGADLIIVTDSVELRGSGSDRDGQIIDYRWSKLTGPAQYTIANPNVAATTAKNLLEGIYLFQLEVKDNRGALAKDTVKVIVVGCTADGRPVINAHLIPIGTLSQARAGMAVGAAGSKILFAGGVNDDNNGTSRVDIYDIITNRWSIAELSIGRHDIGVTTADNKIFFGGGDTTDGFGEYETEYANVDIYDASANRWSVDYLSVPRKWHAAASVGSKVFFAGGCCDRSSINIYNTSVNGWSTGELSEARHNLSAVTAGNKIYFAGGESLPNASAKIDIYDNASSSWSESSLAEPKDEMASISVGNNIYWAGGYNGTNNLSSLVEIKDINTQISTFACLFQPNAGFDAVLKNNQIVFFTGKAWSVTGGVSNKHFC